MSKQEARLILLLLSFMIDSVLTNYLPFSFTKNGIMVVANIGLMMFIFLNHFMNKQDRWVYSIGVGVYFSVIYGKSLLFYVLIYVWIMLLGALYERISSFTFIETLAFVILMIALKEFLIYILMVITNVTHYSLYLFASMRLGPTLICNMIIFIPAYYFFKIYKHIVNERGYDC